MFECDLIFILYSDMNIVIFILVLSLLVLVHEFGHFWVAKKSGVWVEEFGFGLPPRVWGKKVGETLYSINLLPFGGFVKLHGEMTEDGVTDPKRAFMSLAPVKRIPIVVAGVIMNFILAIVCFAIVYSFTGIPRNTERVTLTQVSDNSPASSAGLQAGDIFEKIDEVKITSVEQFVAETEKNKDSEIILTYSRNGQENVVRLKPRVNHPENEGPLGVAISTYENYFPPIWQRPFIGAWFGLKEAFFWGMTIVTGMAMLFGKLFSGTVPSDVAGPVGIYALTSQAASFGILTLINFVGVLSVNLAILNIFPFPALDGGRLFFIVFEAIFGKKILPKVEAIIHTAGMALLLLLIVAITYKDITGLISAGSVAKFLENLGGS